MIWTKRNGALRRPINGLMLGATVVGLTLLATMVSSPAHAATSGAIKGTGSGRCVDVTGGNSADGGQLELWDCNGGANQAFTSTSSGGLQVLGKCLDANAGGRTAGTKVILWSCSGAANQKWTVNGNGTIIGQDSGLCLDATGTGTANGTLLELWTCNGASNQSWSYPAGGGTPTPTPTTSGSSGTGTAPSTTFSIGTRVVTFYRGSRYLPTKIYYPATSSGSNTSMASGRFPLVLFSHGWGGTYDTYVNVIQPLARAGFVVAAPNYPNTKAGSVGIINDAFDGSQSLDASQVITDVLALNTKNGDPLQGHLDTSRGVGAAGHSLGGITTQGLLGLKRDTRITSFIVIAGQSIGAPKGPAAKVLFIHGDADPTVAYSGGRDAYNAIPSSWSKAFLTQVGQGHDSYVWSNGKTYPQTWHTMQDWFRWGLYGDSAARNRLPSDAANGSLTRWESRL